MAQQQEQDTVYAVPVQDTVGQGQKQPTRNIIPSSKFYLCVAFIVFLGAGAGLLSLSFNVEPEKESIRAGTKELDQYIRPGTVVVSAENEVRTGNNFVGIIFTVSNLSQEEKAPFIQAAEKWSKVLAGSENNFEHQKYDNDTVFPGLIEGVDVLIKGDYVFDHLVIIADYADIDGPSRVLGQAFPAQISTDRFEPELPLIVISTLGVMQFDTADIQDLTDSGKFYEVIRHEMGHVLGIGANHWRMRRLLNNPVLNRTDGSRTNNDGPPQFQGFQAKLEYRNLRNGNFLNPVPVEDGHPDFTGNLMSGLGSIDGHWKKTEFDNELMTWALSDGDNPLSRMTIASLEDLGYDADKSEADQYNFTSSGRRLRDSQEDHKQIELRGDVKYFEPITYSSEIGLMEAFKRRYPNT